MTINWYQQLIEDLRKLEFEGIVITKWRIGKRILEDFKKFGEPEYGEHKIEDIAQDMDVPKREIYQCIQLAKKCDGVALLPDKPWRWYVHEYLPENVHFLSGTNEWNTPQCVIGKTVNLFGHIDLDPCSNSHETPNVSALNHFTEEDDGLNRDWFGKVYMNPPYGRVIADWVGKLKKEYEAHRVEEAIALIPSRTDTEWFREFADYPRCFIWGRLKFSEYENSAPFPSMVVYLGNNVMGFVETFGDMGGVYPSSYRGRV